MVDDPRFRRRALHWEGAKISVNTDDPGLFATVLTEENERIFNLLTRAKEARGLDSGDELTEVQDFLSKAGYRPETGQRDLEVERDPALDQDLERSGTELVHTVSASLSEIVAKDPTFLRRLTGHVFEDLFAGALIEIGFDEVVLRARTDLGEADILGFSTDLMGKKIGYIFELKQLGQSQKKVELREITRLLALRDGLLVSHGISQGVFVTTTSFTAPARNAGSLYGIHLQDYEELLDWVRSCYSLPKLEER